VSLNPAAGSPKRHGSAHKIDQQPIRIMSPSFNVRYKNSKDWAVCREGMRRIDGGRLKKRNNHSGGTGAPQTSRGDIFQERETVIDVSPDDQLIRSGIHQTLSMINPRAKSTTVEGSGTASSFSNVPVAKFHDGEPYSD